MTPAQQAFSLLWRRSNTSDPYAKKAYEILRASLTPQERMAAVKWIMSDPPSLNDLPIVR